MTEKKVKVTVIWSQDGREQIETGELNADEIKLLQSMEGRVIGGKYLVHVRVEGFLED